MMIPTLNLLPTSLPRHLSHIRQLDAHGHGEGMALQNQTVSRESTRPNHLHQNHTFLPTLLTSSQLPRYYLYCLLIGQQKGLGGYGKALTALTFTRSFYPQSPPLFDRSSLHSWRYLIPVSLSWRLRQSPMPEASTYCLPRHRWRR